MPLTRDVWALLWLHTYIGITRFQFLYWLDKWRSRNWMRRIQTPSNLHWNKEFSIIKISQILWTLKWLISVSIPWSYLWNILRLFKTSLCQQHIFLCQIRIWLRLFYSPSLSPFNEIFRHLAILTTNADIGRFGSPESEDLFTYLLYNEKYKMFINLKRRFEGVVNRTWVQCEDQPEKS
jgi:hypothetical protein